MGVNRPTHTMCIGLSSRNYCTTRFLSSCFRTRWSSRRVHRRRRLRDRRRIHRRKTCCLEFQ
jgi:hypothetical protein